MGRPLPVSFILYVNKANFKYFLRRIVMNKRLKLLALVLAMGVLCCALIACSQGGTPAASEAPVSEAPAEPAGKFAPGNYTGTAAAHNGEIQITVTFSANKIESIVIDKQAETPNLGENALTDISDKIIAEQSLAIDTVAGATMSSSAMLSAVEDCVVQAGGDVDSLK